MHFGSSRRAAAGLVLALSFGFTGAAHAVDVNARIKGTVFDPQGAVVPGITVTATNQATGVKFTTTTQADGAYLFPQLPIGTYTVQVSAPGFSTFKAAGIVLNIDQEYVEPIKLGVGQTNETVEVAASSVQVNTSDIQLDNVVNHQELVELPLIGRNFTNLELIEPGVQASSDRFGTLSVSGAQSQQSEYLVNGADTNDFAINTIAIQPNLDAIDQFNILQGPLNAEYDRNSGGIVSATIVQGTNHIHGDVFEFYRDTFLNTLNYFQKFSAGAGQPYTGVVSPYHQHIFGGTIGAPLLRDKLFIFGAYQGTRQRVPQTTAPASSVFSTAQRGGNFSSDLSTDQTLNPGQYAFSTNPIPSTISIPGCTAADTWSTCLTRLGGIIPTSSFNKVSTALLPLVPSPNNGLYGYVFNETTASKANQYLGRIDFALNPKNQFTFVGIYQNSVTSNTLPFDGADLPGFGDGSLSEIQQYTFDYVRQLSNTAVNDFALHWTRFNFDSGSPQQVVQPSSLGFSILPAYTGGATVPNLSVNGTFTLGGTTSGPQPRIDQVYQIDDSVSKTFGHHQLKFGYDGRRFNVSNTFGASNSGAYSFDQTANPFTTGDPGLDFLLGMPATYLQESQGIIQADAFLNYLYAQDTWRATEALTIDYGLGYSIDTPLRNHQYNGIGITCFIAGETSKIFPSAPAGIVYPGDPGCSISGRATTHHDELGPRIGFAWSPDLGFISNGNTKQFSIRGGFGIYYNRSEEESALQTLNSPPYGLTTHGAGDFGGTPQLANPFLDINGGVSAGGTTLPSASEANKFPYAPPAPGTSPSFANLEPLGISTYDTQFRAPYSENFQLSVQRQFPSQAIATLSYVGTLGRRNQNIYEGNPETAAGHAACLASQACITDAANQSLDYPTHTAYGFVDPNTGTTAFTSIGTVTSESASSYHSLQASIYKSTTHGLFFQMSYTLSRALDNGSSFENTGFGNSGERGYNQFQKSLNYGNSEFDARQRFVFSPIYTTPLRKSGEWYSPLNLALSGWQISGIYTAATGFPFDISYDGGSSNSLYCSIDYSYYACPDVPVQSGPVSFGNLRASRLSNGHVTSFTRTRFSAEPIGSFGNVARNEYHGPGLNFANLILAKNFNVSKDGVRRLQLRMETDNVFNHTNFANPSGNFSSGSFGQVSGINGNTSGRNTQLAAKFYF